MRVGGYVRLSRDEDKESYSSILSQKSIIADYARLQGWTVEKYYEDDNVSGYSFDRPGFIELIEDLEKDRIDILIAKDLSRIGRHNAYTLLFLDKIKALNKRLILPMEGRGYDTAEDESDLLGITTWYNEMYIKDISRKIRSSIKAKQKEGHFVIRETFGYQRCSADKHKLEMDLEAAEIVKRVFELYLSGIGYRKIAECLNTDGVPTPSQYLRNKQSHASQYCRTAALWNSVHVQRIIKNDIYTGTLRTAKTEKRQIKGKSGKKPESEHLVFENNHPAIISKDTFQEAQAVSEKRNKSHSKGIVSLNNIFSGLLICQDCGSYMIAYNKSGKAKSYICGSYHKNGTKACTRHTVKEADLESMIKLFLTDVAEAIETEINAMPIPMLDEGNDNEQLLKKLKIEKVNSKEQMKALLNQKAKDMSSEKNREDISIIEESYLELENELTKRIVYLNTRIGELETKLADKHTKEQKEPMKLLRQIINKVRLDKKDLEILVDKILIDSTGNPTIYMKGSFQSVWFHNREDVNSVPDQ